ncbi:membrane-bound lytic murein transglycosylase MltF [Salinisphaera sp. SPP-AMP-43]|uniref:membrane-bound lytic murein transglycosylase MltF n=1 Tax=Salinisphaera sp. SPP-AMP-43 TaxID=3121288 RepID=UPI003C6E54E9
MQRLLRLTGLLVLAGFVLAATTCVRRPGALEQVERSGVLRVATVNSATTYYLGAEGPTGFEYDLAQGFASQIGARLEVVVVPDRAAIMRAVDQGRAQLGAGLALSDARRERVRFTPPYLSSELEAVYRQYTQKPTELADLSGDLVLPADTALADWLRHHRPGIDFKVDTHANTEELMSKIAAGDLKATIANADIVAMNQRYYPKLRVGFTLAEVHQRMAWALSERDRRHGHNRLYNKAVAYLETVKDNGRVNILHDRYFGHAARLGFVGGAEFARQVKKRLDHWKSYFKQAGQQYGLDWRLLAAVGYQESRWNEKAISPTAVRGIMMLTRSTAKRMGVANRRDPQQSIDGGAHYLVELRKRLPEAVKPPDRTWFAMAAYNIGLGHVLDARRLLEADGRDPNVWVNLREALGWLSEKRYLDNTRYGYAQGKQAAAYVSDIRAYYDILTWMSNGQERAKPDALAKQPAASSADQAASEDEPDISITSPAF